MTLLRKRKEETFVRIPEKDIKKKKRKKSRLFPKSLHDVFRERSYNERRGKRSAGGGGRERSDLPYSPCEKLEKPLCLGGNAGQRKKKKKSHWGLYFIIPTGKGEKKGEGGNQITPRESGKKEKLLSTEGGGGEKGRGSRKRGGKEGREERHRSPSDFNPIEPMRGKGKKWRRYEWKKREFKRERGKKKGRFPTAWWARFPPRAKGGGKRKGR